MADSTLAEAARAFLVDIDANVTGSMADYLAKASRRLRVTLAAHDQQREPERQMIAEVTAEHASTWTPHGAGFVPDGPAPGPTETPGGPDAR